MILLAN